MGHDFTIGATLSTRCNCWISPCCHDCCL
jgi:hypothetical protein